MNFKSFLFLAVLGIWGSLVLFSLSSCKTPKAAVQSIGTSESKSQQVAGDIKLEMPSVSVSGYNVTITFKPAKGIDYYTVFGLTSIERFPLEAPIKDGPNGTKVIIYAFAPDLDGDYAYRVEAFYDEDRLQVYGYSPDTDYYYVPSKK